MQLKLVTLEPRYRGQLNEMMEQWYAAGEEHSAQRGRTGKRSGRGRRDRAALLDQTEMRELDDTL